MGSNNNNKNKSDINLLFSSKGRLSTNKKYHFVLIYINIFERVYNDIKAHIQHSFECGLLKAKNVNTRYIRTVLSL